MIFAAMDMGTTNTRISLCDKTGVLAQKKGSFGAKFGKTEGKAALYEKTGALFRALLSENGYAEEDLECMTVSGMAGSEMGLCEIPHEVLPTDVYTHARSLVEKKIPEITSLPIFMIPGAKNMRGDEILDVMRGEETEVFGILPHLPREDLVLVLPGTHNKVVSISKSGEILSFVTTLSGEMLDLFVRESILSGSVSFDAKVEKEEVCRGREYAETFGLNAALFAVRTMGMNGKSENEMSSFLFGAVLGEDAKLIRSLAAGKKVFVGGKESLQQIYCALLPDCAVSLDPKVAENAVANGQCALYRLYCTHARREAICSAVEREKLIAIVRGPKKESFLTAMEALYEGGVRLAEITYDRSGNVPKEETAALIASLAEKYRGQMFVGAGTVTSPEEVFLTYEAGGSFVISPNMDPEVIALTRKLGMVSIPAAFTPTEIVSAMNSGADFIKLFPADQLGDGYLKAVKAPLSDAKLLAVGGVNEKNAGAFLKRGFCGVGVGSGLYNHALIDKGDFENLKKLAEAYVLALKEEEK